MKASPIVHVEISADDPERAAEFYREVFGWEIEVDEGVDYWQFAAEGGPGGGFVQPNDPYEAGDVVIYLACDDIEASLSQVEQRGGTVLVPRTEIGPDMGWFALFNDPNGNKLGLYTPGSAQG
jgi:predicted enzyme related to lactoylglutathione lyase